LTIFPVNSRLSGKSAIPSTVRSGLRAPPTYSSNLLFSNGNRIRDGPASTIATANEFPLTEGCMKMKTTITRRTALAVPVTLPLSYPSASSASGWSRAWSAASSVL